MKREHFVYRAYDACGVLLYVGRTNNLIRRWREHRTVSLWVSAAERFRISGPYTLDVAKDLERKALTDEFPIYGDTPVKQSIRRRSEQFERRRYRELVAAGMPSSKAIDKSLEESKARFPQIGYQGVLAT